MPKTVLVEMHAETLHALVWWAFCYIFRSKGESVIVVCNHLKALWPQLDPVTRERITGELERYLSPRERGGFLTTDDLSWESLRDFAKAFEVKKG